MKRGTRVFHKELGIGIVFHSLDKDVFEVQFENKECLTVVNRHMLFTKGDRVKYKNKDDNRWHKTTVTFFAPMIHNPERHLKSRYTVEHPRYQFGLRYVWDIKHVDQTNHKELLDTAVKKAVENHPIDYLDLARTTFRAGQLSDIGIKADKVLKEKVYQEKYGMTSYRADELARETAEKIIGSSDTKEDLLRRLKILELKAQIEELENEPNT